MECIKEKEAVAYVCGETVDHDTARIAAHLAACSACTALVEALRRISGGLAERPGEFDDPTLTADIMTLIDMGRGQRRELPEMAERHRAPRWMVPAVAAAALFLVFMAVGLLPDDAPSQTAMTGIAARGAAQTLDDWVSVALFRRDVRHGGTLYLPVGDVLSASAAVTVAYEDRSSVPFSYLMVFGVDSGGEVHWYYPAYIDEAQNPQSISTGQTRGRNTLPDEITHALPGGPLVFFGLFSNTPLDVRQVESAVRRQLAGGNDPRHIGRIDIEGCGQWSKPVTVVERGE